MSDIISEAIEAVAVSPKSASGDSGSVTQRDLRELIEADKYLAMRDAGTTRSRGLSFTKLINPGPLND